MLLKAANSPLLASTAVRAFLLRLLKTLGWHPQVTAVDFAPEMLDYARARHRSLSAASGPMARIEWLEGDALSLPCHNEQFDAATMGYGLRNVKSIPQALRELHRVVKPGGRVAILDFNRSNDVVSWIQGLALNNIVLPAADSYGLSSEYAYLQPSIQRFLTGSPPLLLIHAFGNGLHMDP